MTDGRTIALSNVVRRALKRMKIKHNLLLLTVMYSVTSIVIGGVRGNANENSFWANNRHGSPNGNDVMGMGMAHMYKKSCFA